MLLPALTLGLFLAANGQAKAAASDVTIQSAQLLAAASPSGCPSVQATLKNNSAGREMVLVDFELRDAGGMLVEQQFMENYGVNPGTQTVSSSCSKAFLPAGTYYYSVGIFSPGWADVVAWYYLPSFSVAECTDRACRGGEQPTPVPQPQPEPQGDVFLVGNTGTQASPSLCKDGLFAIKNTHPYGMAVLVDVELFDSSGLQLTQKFYDNVYIQAGQAVTFEGLCRHTLPAGNYRYSVGIFYPGWKGLIHWYDAADTFTKTDGQVPANTVTPQFISATPVLGTVNPGQTATFNVTVSNSPANISWNGNVDVELYNGSGQMMAQQVFASAIAAGGSQAFTYTTSGALPPDRYTLKVGLFNSGWTQLYQWVDAAASLRVN